LYSLHHVLVHESIADKFIERMLERIKKIKVGNPLDPETMIVPSNKSQMEKS
jgi:acyl-CoA reductase-like NAD-dependent aldehyde dehydrogenase